MAALFGEHTIIHFSTLYPYLLELVAPWQLPINNMGDEKTKTNDFLL